MLRADEIFVEKLAGENRAERQQNQRDQDRPRAFVRVIASGAGDGMHVMIEPVEKLGYIQLNEPRPTNGNDRRSGWRRVRPPRMRRRGRER